VTTTGSAPGPPVPAASRKFLTFVVGHETYGVDILRVQEIRGWAPCTKIPYAPAHVLGVLNLRGSIVPIIDLRVRFHLDHVDYTSVTVIIVLSVIKATGERDVGVVVDSVSDVVDVETSEISAVPDLGSRSTTDHIHGFASVSDRMVVLLDIDRLIATEAVERLEPFARASAVGPVDALATPAPGTS
jgi:purine-binding chemotaxis protein CheW